MRLSAMLRGCEPHRPVSGPDSDPTYYHHHSALVRVTFTTNIGHNNIWGVVFVSISWTQPIIHFGLCLILNICKTYRSIRQECKHFPILYADDTTLCVEAKTVKELEINTFVDVSSCMQSFSEINLINNNTKPNVIKFKLGQHYFELRQIV